MTKSELKNKIQELRQYLYAETDKIMKSEFADDDKKKEWLLMLRQEMNIKVDQLRKEVETFKNGKRVGIRSADDSGNARHA